MIQKTAKKAYSKPQLEQHQTWVVSTGATFRMGTTDFTNPLGDFMDAPTEGQ